MRGRSGSPWVCLVAALAALMLVIAGCGGGNEDRDAESEGSIPADALKGKTFTVGSRESTEQKVLSQITIQTLKAAGATVKDETGLVGDSARESLTSGGIDMYWEYTGAAWLTYLKQAKPIQDERKQYEAVAARDLKENKVRWLDPAPANNSPAFAVKSEDSNKFGVKRISDFGALIAKSPGQASVCVGKAFSTGDDGLPGLEKTYGFKFPEVIKFDEGLILTEINEGSTKGGTCNFGQVSVTDGRISSYNLEIIEDDKAFFPKYNPALNVREDVLKESPQLEAIFAPIAAKLDNAKLQDLNAQVDVKGMIDDEVVQKFLKDDGFIG